MIDPRRNGQLTDPDVDNYQQLADDLTGAFAKIRPGVYATLQGGLIEIHDDTNVSHTELLARLFPRDAHAGLDLLRLLINGG